MADPAFQFTFDGIPAVQPTPDLQAWLMHEHSLCDQLWQIAGRGFSGALTDLTFPMFVNDMQRIKLNRLVYPEGGVLNWGYVFLIFMGDSVATFQGYNGTPSKNLILQSQSGDALTFGGFAMAASIPLSEVGLGTAGAFTGRIASVTNQATTFHLCLFVDERFWAANFSAPYLSSTTGMASAFTSTEQWSDLISNSFATAFPTGPGLGSTVAVGARYGKPSPYSDTVEQGEMPSAILLNAALVNVGQILVRRPKPVSGSLYFTTTVLSAYQSEEATTNSGYTMRAGGDWNQNSRSNYMASVPASVVCCFPVADAGNQDWMGLPYTGPNGASQNYWDPTKHHVRSPLNSRKYYNVNIGIGSAFSDMGLTVPNGTSGSSTWGTGTKTFRCSSMAIVGSGSATIPTNASQLQDLALQIADDFYVRRLSSLRCETWNCIVPPAGTGISTYIYDFGPECSTRIVRGEANGPEYEQMMQETIAGIVLAGLDYCQTYITGNAASPQTTIDKTNGLAISDGSITKTPGISVANVVFGFGTELKIDRAGVYAIDWEISVSGTVAVPSVPPGWTFVATIGGSDGQAIIQRSHMHGYSASPNDVAGYAGVHGLLFVSPSHLPYMVDFSVSINGLESPSPLNWYIGDGGPNLRIVRLESYP